MSPALLRTRSLRRVNELARTALGTPAYWAALGRLSAAWNLVPPAREELPKTAEGLIAYWRARHRAVHPGFSNRRRRRHHLAKLESLESSNPSSGGPMSHDNHWNAMCQGSEPSHHSVMGVPQESPVGSLTDREE